MTCQACKEAHQDLINPLSNPLYPYRWNNATILMIGCREHVQEIMSVLNTYSREKE